MNKQEKWITDYIKKDNLHMVNLIERNFIKDYIEEFKPDYKITRNNNIKCSELECLLTDMCSKHILRKYSQNMLNINSNKFSEWIYCYELI